MPNYIDKDGLSKVWSRTKSYIGGGYYSKSESDNRYISISPQNGGVPIFHVDLPDYSDLNSLYNTEGICTEVFLQNAIKWCCKWATYNGHDGTMTFTGQARPNSQGWYVLNIYDVNDLAEDLPQYSSGIHNNLNTVYEFGTSVFSFICNEIYNANTINTKLNAKSDTGHTHDDRYYTESEMDTKLSGKSDTNHNHTFLQGDGSITIKPQDGNEINFGGTTNTSTIYFGYRAVDSKPIPSIYTFGNMSDGTATLKAANFTGNVNSAGTPNKVYGAVFN